MPHSGDLYISLVFLFFFFLKTFTFYYLFGCAMSYLGYMASLAAALEPTLVACRTYFPDQESNLGPLCWEHRVLATGPPGKFLCQSSISLWKHKQIGICILIPPLLFCKKATCYFVLFCFVLCCHWVCVCVYVQLIYSIVLISVVQEGDLVIHVCAFFLYSFPLWFALCFMVGLCPPILCVIVCISLPQTPSPSLPPLTLAPTSLFFVSLCLFLLCR